MTRPSPSGATTVWQKILSEIAAGTSPPPPYVVRLALGVVALEWRERFVAVEFDIKRDFCVERDTVFGGYVAGLHDQAAGFTMYSCLPDDRLFATKQLNVEYLATTLPGVVRVVAEVDSMDDRVAQVHVRMAQAGKVTSESVVVEALYAAGGRGS